MGGGIDQRYNLSFIVQNSVEIGRPIIGISINYRLSAWGFLASKQVAGSGQTNIGLRDQRQALRWVNENIAAFGGNPSRVTIWVNFRTLYYEQTCSKHTDTIRIGRERWSDGMRLAIGCIQWSQ